MNTESAADRELRLMESFQAVLLALSNQGAVFFNSAHTRKVVLWHLGFEDTDDVRRLLASLRINRVCPLHLDVARALAGNPDLLRRVSDIVLDEFLVDLLGFSRVRSCLSRRFFVRWRSVTALQERLWWATELLDRALGKSVIETPNIDSMRQLLHWGEQASRALRHAEVTPSTD